MQEPKRAYFPVVHPNNDRTSLRCLTRTLNVPGGFLDFVDYLLMPGAVNIKEILLTRFTQKNMERELTLKCPEK
jgi:hypothetical protein